ncbi:MAG: PEP-CTERM sorting domain-containing protein [Burkholderiales bacterium]|nr:PEP-CTERM sorting domain-containing protein [Phycisphaerae bacterium]
MSLFRFLQPAVGCALLFCVSHVSRASLTLSSGLGTTHTGNLVVNGSFELGAPADGAINYVNWVDTSATNYGPIPLWTSSGSTSSAVWGNDSGSPYRVLSSDLLPDGAAGLYMGTSTGVTVNQPPTFNGTTGAVTFPAVPVFTSPSGPVILSQTVPTHLTPAASYIMSFWVSGRENSTNQGNTGAGILGLQMTNVLASNATRWLAVPNGLFFGQSKLYEFTFTPINTSLPVDINFINWGGLDLSPHGYSPFGVQPVLDDVIVNAVPEPGVMGLLGAVAAMLGVRRRTNESLSQT